MVVQDGDSQSSDCYPYLLESWIKCLMEIVIQQNWGSYLVFAFEDSNCSYSIFYQNSTVGIKW